MPEKRNFTAHFVDQLVPPKKGEQWISDSALPNFGIRLWGGKTQGKSYAIRISVNGRVVRKSIIEANGAYLGYARARATQLISQLKHPLPANPLAAKIKNMSFDQLAEHALAHQEVTVTSQQYVDDNRKRFARYTPETLKNKKALRVSPKELRNALNALDHKPAQRRNLRSFYHYMLTLADIQSGERDFWRIAYGMSAEEIGV